MAITPEQLFAHFDQLQHRCQQIEAKQLELEARTKQLEETQKESNTNGN